jgi:hypothetical protein
MPPDVEERGGPAPHPWRFVVAFAAFMIQVCALGISTSVGVYNMVFLRYFGESAASTALIGSINIGVLFGAGTVIYLDYTIQHSNYQGLTNNFEVH